MNLKEVILKNPMNCGLCSLKNYSRNHTGQRHSLLEQRKGKTGDMLGIAERQVYSTLNPDNWTISSLNSLDNMRARQNEDSSQRNYLSIIIALFIMINIFLGTIGILWYNTNLRIHEIGIKRALGSTGAGIKRQLIAENMFLAGLALSIVILIILQVPTFVPGGKLEPFVFAKSVWIAIVTMIVPRTGEYMDTGCHCFKNTSRQLHLRQNSLVISSG